MTETIYDDLIAPELLKLVSLCDEHDMSFVASVEYTKGKTASTHTATQPKSAQQFIANVAAKCRGNFDSLAIAVCRNYDTSASMFLRKFNDVEENAE